MENKKFSLKTRENNKITGIFQVVFGITCTAIAIFWVINYYHLLKSDGTLWITVVFLTGFGVWLIYSGLGFGSRFIEFSIDTIRLKNNIIYPPFLLSVENIKKIEVYPLKVYFILKSSKKILIRFGVTYPEKIENIKDEIINFASSNSISLEILNETIF